MINYVKQIKEILSELQQNIDKLVGLLAFRTSFIKAPQDTVLNTKEVRVMPEDFLKYKKIFETTVNVGLGTPDALKDINDAIVAAAKLVDDTEAKLFVVFRSIIDPVDSIVTELKTQEHVYPLLMQIERMTGSTPAMEVYGPRLISKINLIMTNEQVQAPNISAWLYGILKDLEEDNITEILDTDATYAKVSEILANDAKIPTRLIENANEKYNSIVDLDYTCYNTIKHLSHTPIADLGVVAILGTIVYTIKSIIKLPELDTASDKFDYSSYEMDTSTDFKILATEPSVMLPESVMDPDTYNNYVNRLYLCGAELVKCYEPIHSELYKYRAITRLLLDFSNY